MKTSPRRALSVILAAALLLGAAPQGALAQVVRVAAGPTGGIKITPVTGFAAGMPLAPALHVGAAGLSSGLSAPAVTPAITLAAHASPAAAVVAVPALAASVRAAASEDAPKLPDTPKAAAPAKEKLTWAKLTGIFTNAKAPKTTEAAKTDADLAFDGASAKEDTTTGPVVGKPGIKGAIAAKLSAHKTLSAAKRAISVDEFGGPLAEPMTFKARAGYGLKQGLNLVGIGAILEMTLRPFLELFPWPQYFSDAALRGMGRVALLTNYGPEAIVTGLAESPAIFLGVTLPMAVTIEELTYRLLGFGLMFLGLAAVRPVTRRIAAMLDGLPDAAGVVGGAKRVLKVGDLLSSFAFPIAATLSSFSFAVAHFAAWGFSPYVFVLNGFLGFYLARMAYKSRSLTSPILAHLVFNLVTIGAIAIGLMYSPFAGAAFGVIAGLIGVASLIHNWLSARKETAFRLANGGKAVAAMMLVALSFTALNGPMGRTDLGAQRASATAAMIPVQDTAHAHGLPPEILKALEEAVGEPAAPVESREAMVARVKGSVVNVLVRTPRGMGTGSGFILTPDGVFITNAHVVGSRQPGQFVEARVPGAPGVLKAKVLAVNHDKDLAIVQLQPRGDGKPWPFVKLASRAPREGEDVTATGYPRGLPFTVTAGVISGMDGRGNMYVKHLQTDASINPGNSGGPLFNARGEVVGVNTQIYTQSGGSDGLGFSIMSPEVGRVMAQYAKTGNISTASLGIIANLSDPMAPDAGLEIEYVRHGSAAEKAGLKRGDLIIAVGADKIAEAGQEAAGHTAAALSRMIPGQTTTIVVLRGDEPVELKITFDAKVSAPSR